MKKVLFPILALVLAMGLVVVAPTSASIAQEDVFTYFFPNEGDDLGDPTTWTGEVQVVERMLDEEQTEMFYELELGILGVTGQESFIYEVTNVNWTPINGVNGLSGFNIYNQFDVDTVGNAFGPPGWEAFAGYSGVNTPPNPDNFEWDIRDDVGSGLLVGQTGLFGFTVAAGQYGDGHYGPGSWMHSWSGAVQVDICDMDDISGPVPFWVTKWLEDAWEETPDDGVIDLGERWLFNIGITVSNDLPFPITNVMVKDNFGGDLEVVSVDVMGDMIGPTLVPDPSTLPNGKKPTWSDPTTGVSIQWTGKTQKAHLSWNVGTLPPNFIPPPQSATLFIVVATDMNTGNGNGNNLKFPNGHQEYTSEGELCLNSGATATGLIEGDWAVIDKSDEICVETGQAPMPD